MLALLCFILSAVPMPPAAAESVVGNPGDGLGLAPTPVVTSPVAVGSRETRALRTPPTRDHRKPWVPPVPAVAIAAAGAPLSPSRRRRDHEPIYVLVHGNGGSHRDFDPLMRAMEVDTSRVVAFDYRTVSPGPSSTSVSQSVHTNDVATALDQLLRELSTDHANIYSIHHSKGAAAGVVAISALDDGRRPRIDGYRGAALLDPPIARFPLGPLQRLGRPFRWVPDNGGFDPVHCDDRGCRDVREHLGRSAGVEVIVVRNPDAEFTNFRDEPKGLRVYDLEYDGKPSAWASWWNPVGMVRRVFEAHSSVLSHRSVADCIREEVAKLGSCQWDGAPRKRRRYAGGGGGRNLVR